MKSKIINQKPFKILFVGVLIWITFFVTDFVRVKTDHGPIFCIPVAIYKDGGSIDYVGVLYKVKKEVYDYELAISGEDEGFIYSISPWFVKEY